MCAKDIPASLDTHRPPTIIASYGVTERGYEMAGERVQRRLAAILAADVAGYSRLMGSDDEGTLAGLKARRKLICALCHTTPSVSALLFSSDRGGGVA